jgi:hypothetical protein
MIKRPQWLLSRLAEIGDDVFKDLVTSADASEELAEKILAEDRPLAIAIIAERARGWIKQWMYGKARDVMQDREALGQAPLPFPELPSHLEVGVGINKHQRVMTGPDWDHAEAIWRNRRDQMELGYQIFLRVYDRIRPLLSSDDTLQTGDVVDL